MSSSSAKKKSKSRHSRKYSPAGIGVNLNDLLAPSQIDLGNVSLPRSSGEFPQDASKFPPQRNLQQNYSPQYPSRSPSTNNPLSRHHSDVPSGSFQIVNTSPNPTVSMDFDSISSYSPRSGSNRSHRNSQNQFQFSTPFFTQSEEYVQQRPRSIPSPISSPVRQGPPQQLQSFNDSQLISGTSSINSQHQIPYISSPNPNTPLNKHSSYDTSGNRSSKRALTSGIGGKISFGEVSIRGNDLRIKSKSVDLSQNSPNTLRALQRLINKHNDDSTPLDQFESINQYIQAAGLSPSSSQRDNLDSIFFSSSTLTTQPISRDMELKDTNSPSNTKSYVKSGTISFPPHSQSSSESPSRRSNRSNMNLQLSNNVPYSPFDDPKKSRSGFSITPDIGDRNSIQDSTSSSTRPHPFTNVWKSQDNQTEASERGPYYSYSIIHDESDSTPITASISVPINATVSISSRVRSSQDYQNNSYPSEISIRSKSSITSNSSQQSHHSVHSIHSLISETLSIGSIRSLTETPERISLPSIAKDLSPPITPTFQSSDEEPEISEMPRDSRISFGLPGSVGLSASLSTLSQPLIPKSSSVMSELSKDRLRNLPAQDPLFSRNLRNSRDTRQLFHTQHQSQNTDGTGSIPLPEDVDLAGSISEYSPTKNLLKNIPTSPHPNQVPHACEPTQAQSTIVSLSQELIASKKAQKKLLKHIRKQDKVIFNLQSKKAKLHLLISEHEGVQNNLEENVKGIPMLHQTISELTSRIDQLNQKLSKFEDAYISSISAVNELDEMEDYLASKLILVKSRKNIVVTEQLSQLKNKVESFQCKICWERDVSTVFLPCGHAVCCIMCSRKLTECPLCRSAISQKMDIFT